MRNGKKNSRKEVGELAGESEQIVASHPEHHFPKHPVSEDAFQIRVEIAHDGLGYPPRGARTNSSS
jgi:hypothetical protein